VTTPVRETPTGTGLPDTERVVITGMGVVSSIGVGVDEFASGLMAGRSGVSRISAFDTAGFDRIHGCEVRRFEADEHIERLDAAALGRASQFSVSAAALAVRDAGLSPDALAGHRVLVSVGTTDGESQDLDRVTETCVQHGKHAVPTAVLARIPPGRLSATVVHELNLRHAEAVTIPTACAAGNYAIGYAYDVLRLGEAQYALCGGADAMCRKTFAGFYRLGTIAPEVCQPFDADRQGILTGEGAAILMLETLDNARRRGARIYAEVLGYGLTCDASHPVAPDRASIAECMRRAHRNAGVTPSGIDLISAHGTGTQANDLTEAAAIREVFGAAPPPTTAIKSMLGHTMGAASALGAVACAVAIDHGFIPPTMNHRHTDPGCDIDCVPNTARPARLRVVQNNAFAFGGNNAILVLGAMGRDGSPEPLG
jgi:3-oxoacyl-[acyl-carrier-protein] synthase II